MEIQPEELAAGKKGHIMLNRGMSREK